MIIGEDINMCRFTQAEKQLYIMIYGTMTITYLEVLVRTSVGDRVKIPTHDI